jgi:hypothetical protein
MIPQHPLAQATKQKLTSPYFLANISKEYHCNMLERKKFDINKQVLVGQDKNTDRAEKSIQEFYHKDSTMAISGL